MALFSELWAGLRRAVAVYHSCCLVHGMLSAEIDLLSDKHLASSSLMMINHSLLSGVSHSDLPEQVTL